MHSEESSNNATHVYDEIYRNDHPFVICMLPSDAQTYKGCKNDFCNRQKIIPFDLMFSHKERYFFPQHGDWKSKKASNKELTLYYHADRSVSSISCHGSLTSLTTISRFATHSKNRAKFIRSIYSRYQFSGKFLCSFVSWDLENKMISRWSISNPAMFFIISKCQNV